jgi:hypothetical protein
MNVMVEYERIRGMLIGEMCPDIHVPLYLRNVLGQVLRTFRKVDSAKVDRLLSLGGGFPTQITSKLTRHASFYGQKSA